MIGLMRSVAIGDTGRRALVYGTRTHFYEGRGVRAVVHAVRTAAAAGCRTIVLTNGCGGLNPAWAPGTLVLIRDHLNLTATSPIEGASFVDLTGQPDGTGAGPRLCFLDIGFSPSWERHSNKK